MGSFKKAAKSFVSAPVEFVKSTAKGDVGGMADSLVRGATYGGVSLESGKGVIDVKKGLGNLSLKVAGTEVNSESAEEQVKSAKEETRKQRRALFMTAGDELGEQVLNVTRKKRGALFGNKE